MDHVDTVDIVYAEPHQYRFHSSPASSTIFNLSDSFLGVSPLPGFAKLQGPEENSKPIFIVFLGFEGMRASQIAITLESVPKTVPVLGIPGFQMEFPAHAISCNWEFLEEARAHTDIQFAKASCPFEAYEALKTVQDENPSAYMYIAPIGTKPHALGAILFALENPQSVEIVYDHPVRSPQRSSGVGPIHIYRIKENHSQPELPR
ncbi:hypothetical protein [Corallococcus aberystwythensis]|uniref:hypothetical protein n=1 Tax=Corallococcus aberystwythensis TaxID=2316722 RepID=UPI0011C439B7|nr:hypothetical protein [Corallococcus aberystwythensis]